MAPKTYLMLSYLILVNLLGLLLDIRSFPLVLLFAAGHLDVTSHIVKQSLQYTDPVT